MYDYDFAMDMEEQNAILRKRNKQKLNELLDKYGGSREAINQHADLKDSMEYLFSHGDKLIDEVLEERRLAQGSQEEQNPLKISDGNISQRDKDKFLKDMDALNLTAQQRENLKKLSLSAQISLIRDLKEERELKIHQLRSNSEAMKSKPQTLHEILLSKSGEDEEQNSVKDNKKEMKKNSNKKTPVDLYLNEDYFNKLGMLESSNNYMKVERNGKGIGAIGKYQMRGLGLMDLGYLDRDYHWTGKNGLRSVEDFKRNGNLQEKIARDFSNLNYRYLKSNGSLSYIGVEIDGKVNDFKITVPGLIAAAHKEGAGGVHNYLRLLEKGKNGKYHIPYNKYKNDVLRGLLAVETRLRVFSNINND